MRRRLHERESHRIRLSFSSARCLVTVYVWRRFCYWSDPIRSGLVRPGPVQSDPILILPTAAFKFNFFSHIFTAFCSWDPQNCIMFHWLPKIFGFASVIHWIVIYPVDSTIHPCNNRNRSTSSNLSTSSISSNLSFQALQATQASEVR